MNLYGKAEKIINCIKKKKSTVKSLVHSSAYENKRVLYALICETLKYESVLDEIITRSDLMKKVDSTLKKSMVLLKLLLYDFLFGKGIRGSARRHRISIEKHQSSLRSTLARLKVERGVMSNQQLLPHQAQHALPIPRYVRVNLLKTSIADVIEHFRSEGYSLIPCSTASYERYIDVIRGLKKHEFVVDIHIGELLAFAPNTDLHDHVLYRRGDIILQDKASCFPAHVLAPPQNSHVIDCCAAPGNKTTHVAAKMNNHGKVFAFDKDARRVATMNTLTLTAGVLNITLSHQDFLKVSPCDSLYSEVTHFIVDPSCSGSGLVNRHDDTTEGEGNLSQRLKKLAEFQSSILLHALSFPKAMKVVYSTCSVHEEENENVVAHTLEKVKVKFMLVDVVPELPSRGCDSFPDGKKCLRLTPANDLCTGFFVACFERRSDNHITPEANDADHEIMEDNDVGHDQLSKSQHIITISEQQDESSQPLKYECTVENVNAGVCESPCVHNNETPDVTEETLSVSKCHAVNIDEFPGCDGSDREIQSLNKPVPSNGADIEAMSEKKKRKRNKKKRKKDKEAALLNETEFGDDVTRSGSTVPHSKIVSSDGSNCKVEYSKAQGPMPADFNRNKRGNDVGCQMKVSPIQADFHLTSHITEEQRLNKPVKCENNSNKSKNRKKRKRICLTA